MLKERGRAWIRVAWWRGHELSLRSRVSSSDPALVLIPVRSCQSQAGFWDPVLRSLSQGSNHGHCRGGPEVSRSRNLVRTQTVPVEHCW